ncbi:MAG: redoxin domain-containing protein [Chloroflexi bacterium]|nr:redoxin domain-containing protein [Chloroflexota bacterium]
MTLSLLQTGEAALDFELNDLHGTPIRLSNYYGKQPIVLSFLRGFM